MADTPTTSGNGGGLGRVAAPGTRIGRQLGEGSELWLNVKFALVAAVAADVGLTVLILSVFKLGWWLMPILGAAFGFVVGFAALTIAGWLRVGFTRAARVILGNLWGAMAILGGFGWYAGRVWVDPAFALAGVQLAEVYRLDWWWYALAVAVILLVARVVGKWWAPLMAAVVLYVSGVAMFSDPDAWAEVWSVVSWFGLFYLWPVAGMASVLVVVMIREMGWPNAEFTLNPVDVRDLGPGGLASFYLPWLLHEPKAEPGQLYTVKGELELDDRSIRYLEFELDSYESAVRWHKFCKAVHYKGRNFSYTEAVKRHHLSEDDWDGIYDAFVAQQWVIPAGPRGTPTLKAVGRHWVRLYADTPPPRP